MPLLLKTPRRKRRPAHWPIVTSNGLCSGIRVCRVATLLTRDRAFTSMADKRPVLFVKRNGERVRVWRDVVKIVKRMAADGHDAALCPRETILKYAVQLKGYWHSTRH